MALPWNDHAVLSNKVNPNENEILVICESPRENEQPRANMLQSGVTTTTHRHGVKESRN